MFLCVDVHTKYVYVRLCVGMQTYMHSVYVCILNTYSVCTYTYIHTKNQIRYRISLPESDVCMYVCMYVYISAYVCVWYVCVYISVYACAWYVCVYICMSMCVGMNVTLLCHGRCVYMYVCAHVCMLYVCVCMCISTY